MKKVFSLLMALLMLALPVLSVAEESVPAEKLTPAEQLLPMQEMAKKALDAGRRIESVITMGGLPAGMMGDETADAAMAELFDALRIEISEQGDEGAFVVKMADKSLLDAALAVSGEDLYLSSNLLGGAIVVGEKEVEPLVGRILDLFVTMEALTQEEADDIKQQLPEIIAMVKAEMANAAAAQLTEEDILALDYSALITAIAPIAAKATTEPVTAQPKNSDPAATLVTVTVTPDDAKAVIKALFQFIKDNPKLMAYIENQMGTNTAVIMEDETFSVEQLLDEAMADLEDETVFTQDAVIRVYLDEAGMPVLADTVLYLATTEASSIKDAEGNSVYEETIVEVPVELNYVRLTTAQGVTHTVNAIMEKVSMTLNAIEKEDGISLTFDLVDTEGEGNGNTMQFTMDVKEDESASMVLDIVDEEEFEMHLSLTMAMENTDTACGMDVTFSMSGTEEGETILDLSMVMDADYAINGVDYEVGAVIDIFYAGEKVFTITANAKTTDPAPSIMSGNVVRPAELNDNDLALWFVNVMNTVQAWPMQFVMSLPQSVLTLLMGN